MAIDIFVHNELKIKKMIDTTKQVKRKIFYYFSFFKKINNITKKKYKKFCQKIYLLY